MVDATASIGLEANHKLADVTFSAVVKDYLVQPV